MEGSPVWTYSVFLLCYLIGALPFGYILGRLKGIDVRRFGSGNIGATNVFRVLGPVGALVLALDVGKGVAAAALGVLAFPGEPVLQVMAGLAAVSGHNWSVFLKFRGGKGVATTAGVLLYLMPLLIAVAIVVFLLVVGVTRYVSLGSLMLGVTLAVGSLVSALPDPFVWASWLMALFIFYRHLENIKRLLSGTEAKFGERINMRGPQQGRNFPA